MQFSTAALSLLALAITAVNAGPIQPLFTCEAPTVGGCCESFLPSGTGVGCVLSDQTSSGDYTCNDKPGKSGQPACCTVFTGPGHIGIPLPCNQTSW